MNWGYNLKSRENVSPTVTFGSVHEWVEQLKSGIANKQHCQLWIKKNSWKRSPYLSFELHFEIQIWIAVPKIILLIPSDWVDFSISSGNDISCSFELIDKPRTTNTQNNKCCYYNQSLQPFLEIAIFQSYLSDVRFLVAVPFLHEGTAIHRCFAVVVGYRKHISR